MYESRFPQFLLSKLQYYVLFRLLTTVRMYLDYVTVKKSVWRQINISDCISHNTDSTKATDNKADEIGWIESGFVTNCYYMKIQIHDSTYSKIVAQPVIYLPMRASFNCMKYLERTRNVDCHRSLSLQWSLHGRLLAKDQFWLLLQSRWINTEVCLLRQ